MKRTRILNKLYRLSCESNRKFIQKQSDFSSGVALSDYEAASFDVYDTCITRLVGNPASIFHFLACNMELPQKYKKKPFAEYRIIAEKMTHARYKEKTTLDDIYTQLGKFLELSEGYLNLIKHVLLVSSTEGCDKKSSLLFRRLQSLLG
jgi:hypothetical protein